MWWSRYFTSIADAENDLNTITNPENFENTSNPQTVFVKVTNTDFNCPCYFTYRANRKCTASI